MADRKKGSRVVRQKPDRRANRTILIRSLFLMAVFGLMVFIPLFFKLWQIQISQHDYYQELAVRQQTRHSTRFWQEPWRNFQNETVSSLP